MTFDFDDRIREGIAPLIGRKITPDLLAHIRAKVQGVLDSFPDEIIGYDINVEVDPASGNVLVQATVKQGYEERDSDREFVERLTRAMEGWDLG